MANFRADFPDHLTFSQRYGYEPLPEPMRLEEISPDLRREIWNATREVLVSIRKPLRVVAGYYFGQGASRLIERVLGKLLKKSEDEINTSHDEVLNQFKMLILQSPFNRVLELVEAFVNDEEARENFRNRIGNTFEPFAKIRR